jgi:hypothetical protein
MNTLVLKTVHRLLQAMCKKTTACTDGTRKMRQSAGCLWRLGPAGADAVLLTFVSSSCGGRFYKDSGAIRKSDATTSVENHGWDGMETTGKDCQ